MATFMEISGNEGGKLIRGMSLIRRKIFLGNNNRNRDVYRNLRTIRDINIVQLIFRRLKEIRIWANRMDKKIN